MFLLENEIENAVVDHAKDLGIEVTKMNLLGNRNWPDRVFWIEGGRPFLIEFKFPGEPLRKGQRAKIKKLRRLGYDVEVCDDADVGKRLIADHLAAAKVSKARSKVASRARVRRVVS